MFVAFVRLSFGAAVFLRIFRPIVLLVLSSIMSGVSVSMEERMKKLRELHKRRVSLICQSAQT